MSEIRIRRIDEVESFRLHLAKFNHELAESLASIRGHWASLHDDWDDDMYRSFGAALDDVTPGIDSYLAATDGHERYLRGFIARARAFRELAGG